MFDGLDGLAHVFDGLAHVFDGQLGSAADTREEFLYRAALRGVLPPAVGPRLRGVAISFELHGVPSSAAIAAARIWLR